METKSSKPPLWLICLLWIALPLSWSEYRQHWDQLPIHMAVHFDADWQPNGFTTREGSMQMGLGIMAAILALFTAIVFAFRSLKPQAAWPALVIAYVIAGFCWYGNHSIVKFNLRSHAVKQQLCDAQSSVLTSQSVRLLPPPLDAVES